MVSAVVRSVRFVVDDCGFSASSAFSAFSAPSAFFCATATVFVVFVVFAGVAEVLSVSISPCILCTDCISSWCSVWIRRRSSSFIKSAYRVGSCTMDCRVVWSSFVYFHSDRVSSCDCLCSCPNASKVSKCDCSCLTIARVVVSSGWESVIVLLGLAWSCLVLLGFESS